MIIPVDAEAVVQRVTELKASIDEMHSRVQPDELRSAVAADRRAVRVNWAVGDYVLMARVSKGATNKLVAKWRGPMRVISTVNPWVFKVTRSRMIFPLGVLTNYRIQKIKQRNLVG